MTTNSPGTTATSNYPPTSRYHATPVAEMTMPDGRKVAYLRRRMLPQPGRLVLLQEHTVADGERSDLIAAHYLGDSEQEWRICDANNVIHPDELTATVGRRLRITLPEGIPGGVDA